MIVYDRDGNEITLIENNELAWEKINVFFDPDKFNVASQSAYINRKLKLISFNADVTTKVAVNNGDIGSIETGIYFQSYNAGVRVSSGTPIFAFSSTGNGMLSYWAGKLNSGERLLFSFVERLL